jgi:hypothetical protein
VETNRKEESVDLERVRKILDDWQARVSVYQEGHYKSAQKLEKYHYQLGLPSAILTAITGATVFTNLNQEMSISVKVAVGTISLLAAVLVGIQTFYNFSKRSESHRSIASQFGHIRREIDILKQFPPEDQAQLEAKIRELNEVIGRISGDAPTIEAPHSSSTQISGLGSFTTSGMVLLSKGPDI